MPLNIKYLILGGGPTGLGAAYRLKELGEDSFLVLDKNTDVGGLSTTIKDKNGFLWDIGGHIQFSHYDFFTQVMYKAINKENWLSHEREAWVWMRNNFVPYPFQNNLKFLPKDDIWKCIRSLLEINNGQKHKPINNFKEWINLSFGKGIAEVFMNPYNFKVWAYPLEKMSFQWIGERVSVLDLSRILQNIILDGIDISWGPNNNFEFPEHGGTGAIWKAVANLIGDKYIKLNSKATKVNLIEKAIYLENGEIIKYEQVISSIPIDKLSLLSINIPESITTKASQLVHTSTNIIGIGLAGKAPKHLSKKCWMYFPENNSPYYRVTVFSNYSPNNVPDSKNNWSLMAEVSESSFKPCQHETLIVQIIKAMLEDKLIESEDDILSTWQHFEPYGYPVPSIGRDDILGEIIPFFENHDIYSRGRFGAWKYEVSNQDHSFMQGVEVVERLVLGKEEETFVNPSVVNNLNPDK